MQESYFLLNEATVKFYFLPSTYYLFVTQDAIEISSTFDHESASTAFMECACNAYNLHATRGYLGIEFCFSYKGLVL